MFAWPKLLFATHQTDLLTKLASIANFKIKTKTHKKGFQTIVQKGHISLLSIILYKQHLNPILLPKVSLRALDTSVLVATKGEEMVKLLPEIATYAYLACYSTPYLEPSFENI